MLGSSGGQSERTQLTRSSWNLYGDKDFTQQTSWNNSFSVVSGTMAIQRYSSTAGVSCAWTAHNVQIAGRHFFSSSAPSFLTRSTSFSDVSVTRSGTSTSGGCGIGVSWFLPIYLHVDQLAAGSSPALVPFDIKHRGAIFASNWYPMGLPSPNLAGTSYLHTYSPSGWIVETRQQTWNWSSSATLSSGSPILLEDLVLP